MKQKRRVNFHIRSEDFVATLAEHVPDRYRHAIRYFGLLAPVQKHGTGQLYLRCWANISDRVHDDSVGHFHGEETLE